MPISDYVNFTELCAMAGFLIAKIAWALPAITTRGTLPNMEHMQPL